MAKELQKRTRPRAKKRALASATPGLIAAVSLLSAALGISMSDVAIAGDKSNTAPNTTGQNTPPPVKLIKPSDNKNDITTNKEKSIFIKRQ